MIKFAGVFQNLYNAYSGCSRLGLIVVGYWWIEYYIPDRSYAFRLQQHQFSVQNYVMKDWCHKKSRRDTRFPDFLDVIGLGDSSLTDLAQIISHRSSRHMSELDPKRVRLAPNETNPGIFFRVDSVQFGSSSQYVLNLNPWIFFQIQMAPNGTNPGIFIDQIQYILAHRAKMYWIWSEKNPRIYPIYGQSEPLWVQIWFPGEVDSWMRCTQAFRCTGASRKHCWGSLKFTSFPWINVKNTIKIENWMSRWSLKQSYQLNTLNSISTVWDLTFWLE